MYHFGRLRMAFFAVVVASLALFAVACGDEEDEDSPASSGTGGAAATATTDPNEVAEPANKAELAKLRGES